MLYLIAFRPRNIFIILVILHVMDLVSESAFTARIGAVFKNNGVLIIFCCCGAGLSINAAILRFKCLAFISALLLLTLPDCRGYCRFIPR